MARIRVFLDGRTESNGTPLLMHSDRLADPLDTFSLEIKKTSNKRNKTEVDHIEMSRLEFFGGLYTEPRIEAPDDINGQDPVMPVWNIVRMIQEAAKRHKLGRNVLRAVIPATTNVPIIYDGARDIQEMWDTGKFALRKPVGVGASRTLRTRPLFVDWQIEADIEVDTSVLDPEKLNQLVEEAGRYEGLGDNRPVYGRFKGRAELVKETA